MPPEMPSPQEPLETRVSRKITTTNETTKTIAESLLNRGASEKRLAVFAGMHDAVNYIADQSELESAKESGMLALGQVLEAIANRVGSPGAEKHGWEALAANPEMLKAKVMAAFDEVMRMPTKK